MANFLLGVCVGSILMLIAEAVDNWKGGAK